MRSTWDNCCDQVVEEAPNILPVARRRSCVIPNISASSERLVDSSLPIYITSYDKDLCGKPLFSCMCAYNYTCVSPVEMQWCQAVLTVHPNGFRVWTMTSPDGDDAMSHIFEAFTVLAVRDVDEGGKMLRMSIPSQGDDFKVHSFLFYNENAVNCSLLAEAMHEALTLFTLSLFPEHTISVWPVPDIESTLRRIMAGYLLMYEASNGAVCVVYGELSSFWCGKASFVIYTNDSCVSVVEGVEITEDMHLQVYHTPYCNCFSVNHCRFCARTCAEMLLWTRALTNVKTKLTYGAPNPTEATLLSFRLAVLEQVVLLKPMLAPTARRDLSQLELVDDNAKSDCSTKLGLACTEDGVETKFGETQSNDLGIGFGIMAI